MYFWLIPAYIAFYTMVPRAAGGRLYSDTMGRLTFILFLIYSLPVGMHHLLMDPEHGNATKFIQVLLTAFVSVPTLLTIFTITASLEIAGRLRGGRGVFGWITALPWERPMVLATGLGFVMLGFGGFGGIINMVGSLQVRRHRLEPRREVAVGPVDDRSLGEVGEGLLQLRQPAVEHQTDAHQVVARNHPMDSRPHSCFTSPQAGVCRKLADACERRKARCSAALMVRTSIGLTRGHATGPGEP